MPVKLIIFDLDGTLIDSSRDITNAVNYAIRPYSLGPLREEDTIRMVGAGITRLIEEVIGKDHMAYRDDVLNRFLDYYSRHITDFTRPYPMVAETLARLRHYKKAVVSNKRELLSRSVLDRLGLSAFFDMIAGSDTATERKPSPQPLIKVLKTIGARPDEALMVGDSNLDIEAGRAAGMRTVAVTYGYRGREFLKEADYTIDNMYGLIALIDVIDGTEG